MAGPQAVGYFFGDGQWFEGDILTNPTNGTVLVDTGPLLKGVYLIAVTGAGSADWVYDLQHRDSANATTVEGQRRRPAAGNEDWVFGNKIPVDTNERIRAVLVGNVTGEIQMSLLIQEVV